MHVRQGSRRAAGKLGETFGSQRTDGGVGFKPCIDGWDLSRDGGVGRGGGQKRKKKKENPGRPRCQVQAKIGDLTLVSEQ